MQPNKIQDHLFMRIKELLPTDSQLVETIAENLHISNDSAYRRIRGETPLVLDEAHALCSLYGLSLDDTLGFKKDSVSFQVMGVSGKENDFENYWHKLLQTMKAIVGFNKKEIIYLSKDIPFFHNFCFPELFAFRHFFWMKSILKNAEFEEQLFSFDCILPAIANTGRAILQTYNEIPSTEIWNAESINSTLSQIEHFREAGFFKSKDDIHHLYDVLAKTIEHVQLQTEVGRKFLPGENFSLKPENFTLYYNRVVLGDNTIVIIHDRGKTIYLNYDVLNYMYTHDATFCNEVHAKIKTLMGRATILSQVSEKQRSIFFNSLYKKIEHCKRSTA